MGDGPPPAPVGCRWPCRAPHRGAPGGGGEGLAWGLGPRGGSRRTGARAAPEAGVGSGGMGIAAEAGGPPPPPPPPPPPLCRSVRIPVLPSRAPPDLACPPPLPPLSECRPSWLWVAPPQDFRWGCAPPGVIPPPPPPPPPPRLGVVRGSSPLGWTAWASGLGPARAAASVVVPRAPPPPGWRVAVRPPSPQVCLPAGPAWPPPPYP